LQLMKVAVTAVDRVGNESFIKIVNL
jgi:hypothetical protein